MRPICTNGYLRLPIRIYDLRVRILHTYISGRAPAADAIKRLYTQYYILISTTYNNAGTRIL